MGAFAYVAKPVGLGQLHQTVAAALGRPDPLARPALICDTPRRSPGHVSPSDAASICPVLGYDLVHLTMTGDLCHIGARLALIVESQRSR